MTRPPTPKSERIATLPHGEQFVSMAVCNGHLYVASTTRVWHLHPERGLESVEFAPDPEIAVAPTVVVEGPKDQA